MKVRLLVLLFLDLFSFAEHALVAAQFPVEAFGDQVGNGGKAIICRDESGRIVSSEILDFFEGKILYNLQPHLTDGDYLAKAKGAISALANHDRERHDFYQKQLNEFLSNTRFIPNALIETPDSDHIIAPPNGCAIEQAAIQIKPSFPSDRRYTINASIWNSLDDNNRAGLVLHEIIYFEGIARGHRNSIAVRFFNSHLSSDSIARMSIEEYTTLIASTKLGNQTWVNPKTGSKWIFVTTLNANWHVAKNACSILASGVLPAPAELQASATELLSSPIFSLVYENYSSESWTAARRPIDGLVAVGIWSISDIELAYRNQSVEYANVLCVKHSKEVEK